MVRAAGQISSLPAVVGFFLLASGCASSDFGGGIPHTYLGCDYDGATVRGGPAVVPAAYTSAADIPADAVIITNDALYRQIVVHSLVGARSATSTVQVTARIANCSDEDIVVRGRTSFLNARMTPAEKPTAWSIFHVPPGAFGTYEASSYSTDAAFYFIEVAPE